MNPIRPRARFLMCRPVHFAVNYAINPWMDPQSWATDARVHAATSRQEWTALSRRLTDLGAAIELVPPAPDVPDLVFTATAVVLNRQVLLARFRHPERQREEPHSGCVPSLQAGPGRAVRAPQGLVLRRRRCVWDRARNLFWMGWPARCRRVRSDIPGRR
jgi:hypothetical protein